MDTLLIPPPGDAPTELEPSTNGSTNGAHPPGRVPHSLVAPAEPATTCVSCGRPLEPGQQWCLHCGSRAPDKLESSHAPPGWRSAALVLGATAVLVVGAAAAGYAALTHKNHAPPRALAATHPTLTPTAPPVTTPPATTAPATPAPGLAAHPPATPPALRGTARGAGAGAANPLFSGGSAGAGSSAAAGLGTTPSAAPPPTPAPSATKAGSAGSLFPASTTKPGSGASKPGHSTPAAGSKRASEEEA
ncbi:MAG: hypothetical protein FWD42_08880, partial [Solirubrobacterales bacterium]|nr:hypothetical protein [Solirubrobacterales bacterium]